MHKTKLHNGKNPETVLMIVEAIVESVRGNRAAVRIRLQCTREAARVCKY
jgi:hypothetical protein